MTDRARDERQRRARERLEAARADIRHERREVMARLGHELRAWRETSGIQQQVLGAEGLVSATVVRGVEKGSYESPPPGSLITAVARLGGPSGDLQELAKIYRDLQARQRHIDTLLSRNEVPEDEAWLRDGNQARLAAGLRPAVWPRSPSLFAGRREELSALTHLLDSQRLVTVVGPGGIGKTALCLHYADSLPLPLAGPWFADLSRVQAGESVLPVLADLILEDPGETGDDARIVTRFGALLADTPSLIIVDNCEHVLASATMAVTRILNACPRVRILATSREPLHLPDESLLTVGPLSIANRDSLDSGSPSGPGDAIELFIRLLGRTRGEEPQLSSAQVAEIAELCRALDGIPLCMELAAARARVLSVSDLAVSVGRGLALLSGGSQDVPRHEAIEATISWSWNLLDLDERRALSRLAILTAPFTFRCGALVAHEEPSQGERLVAALTDKSLVSREMTGTGNSRFKVLGVVRSFAIRQLSPEDRRPATEQLMSWALEIARAAEPGLQRTEAIEHIDADFPLIRLAIEASENAPADQVRLIVAIWRYCHIRSLSAYGCRFLAKAGEEEIRLTSTERARAFNVLANLLAYQGRHAESIDAAQRSVRLRRALGDPNGLRHDLLTLLGCLIEARRFDEADHCLAEVTAIPGPVELSAVGDINVRQGLLCLHRGDPQRAIRLLTEAARCFSIERMTLAHGFCLGYLSVAQRRAGDLDASLRTALVARELLDEMSGPGYEAEVTVGLAAAYLALGRQEDALTVLDTMPAEEHIRPQARLHSLVLRAMAAGAAAPSAAAAFLLAHASEFARGSDEQAMLLIRAAQDITYRSGAYENAGLLLGVLIRSGSDTREVEVGLPVIGSADLQRHLPQSVLEAVMTDGYNTDPRTALGLAVSALTELVADGQAQLSLKSAPDPSATFGTRLMLLAPHSLPPS